MPATHGRPAGFALVASQQTNQGHRNIKNTRGTNTRLAHTGSALDAQIPSFGRPTMHASSLSLGDRPPARSALDRAVLAVVSFLTSVRDIFADAWEMREQAKLRYPYLDFDDC
jgi:hypothetical protein